MIFENPLRDAASDLFPNYSACLSMVVFKSLTDCLNESRPSPPQPINLSMVLSMCLLLSCKWFSMCSGLCVLLGGCKRTRVSHQMVQHEWLHRMNWSRVDQFHFLDLAAFAGFRRKQLHPTVLKVKSIWPEHHMLQCSTVGRAANLIVANIIRLGNKGQPAK